MIKWLKLKILENKLAFGEFGGYTKYLRLCHERNATTTSAKLAIAQEVLDWPCVSTLEGWGHAIYLKEHVQKKKQQPDEPKRPK